jgi:hypothetical protein
MFASVADNCGRANIALKVPDVVANELWVDETFDNGLIPIPPEKHVVETDDSGRHDRLTNVLLLSAHTATDDHS